MGIFGKKRVTAGLDIGSSFVKLAEVDHGGDHPKLRQIVARPLPEGAFAEGEIANEDLLADQVRRLLDAAAVRSRNVITALGGHDIFIKKIEMPRVKAADARDLIGRAAERYVPFDLQSVQLDFQILRAHGPDGRMDVLLVAAKKKCVEDRISLLANADASVALMEVEALALCNGLCHNYPGASEGMVVLVNLGHEVTNIVILEDGAPTLIRDVPLGLRRFSELLQQVHGLPAEWAQEVIRGRRELKGFGRALETGADVVAVGIERACAFLGTRRPGGGLGRVFLSGGGACVPGAAEVIGRRMKVETRVANPCERVSVAPDLRGRNTLAGAAPLFLKAIGLALRGA